MSCFDRTFTSRNVTLQPKPKLHVTLHSFGLSLCPPFLRSPLTFIDPSFFGLNTSLTMPKAAKKSTKKAAKKPKATKKTTKKKAAKKASPKK